MSTLINITKQDWFKAEQFYLQNCLEYKLQHATPAMFEMLKSHLSNLQKLQTARESHPVWRIPIKILYQPNSNGRGIVFGIMPDLARSSVVGIHGLDAADTIRDANQSEIPV